MGKSLRQFTCRDDLWARVEALAERRGISADDVVQAALVQLFTRKKSSSTETPSVGARPPAVSPPTLRTPTRSPGPPIPAATLSPRVAPPRMPPPPLGREEELPARPLFLWFEGQVYEVDQDQFVIGRGSKYSDLAIKDANISRRHCAIVRRNGQYFIKDLESTNGVEFNGQRVDNHLIQEGTTYRLCDHEIRFTFVPPG